jgi:antibiotic biosynthesis monooxygenase (ABM) superfamily enzyme
MASRKVRRRRAKLQRHEYEYVIETEEGEEVVERPKPAGKAEADKQPVDRRGRPVQKPSWQRTLRRSAIFVPLIVILAFLLGGDLTTGQKLFQALFLTAIFVPFSHLIDVLMYRSFLKRQARSGGQGSTKR